MIKRQSKILVIDDDPGALRILEKWLKVAGFEVKEAWNGRLGIKMAIEEQPDLVILDMMIPDMTGGEVIKVLREDSLTKDIPVIFISATFSKEEDKLNETVEVNGYICHAFAKPLHQPKLLSVIKKLIKKGIREKII